MQAMDIQGAMKKLINVALKPLKILLFHPQITIILIIQMHKKSNNLCL